MKIPFIKITQKGESFYLVKFSATELRNKVNFHFRNPYSNERQEVELAQDYIHRLENKGIKIQNEYEGVQRRIDITRINSIRTYLENANDSFFPTSLILALDPLDSNQIINVSEIEENDSGYIVTKDEIHFQIIDGQHRLAGLFISKEEIQEHFELSAVLLIDATTHMCAKIFSDVNGNQKQVSKSVIYDLFDLRNPQTEEEKILKVLHGISYEFNNDIESPFYRHIKMMGIGSGAISQAFFIETFRGIFHDLQIDYRNITPFYQTVFMYFKAFQRNLKEDWPVYEIKDESEQQYKTFYEHSNRVLKQEKSQLLKTNGFGAISLLFEELYHEIKFLNYVSISDIILRLRNKFNWKDDPLLTGTSKKTQKLIKDRLLSYIRAKD